MDAICNSSGICSYPAAYEHTLCTTDDDCALNETYMGKCTGLYDHVSGKRYCNFEDASATCKKYRDELASCLETYGCSPVISRDKNACSYYMCSTHVNRVLGCESSCQHVVDTVGRRCTVKYLSNRCPTTPYWESLAFSFYSLLTAILIFFIVYNLCSLKKSESSQSKSIDYYRIQ